MSDPCYDCGEDIDLPTTFMRKVERQSVPGIAKTAMNSVSFLPQIVLRARRGILPQQMPQEWAAVCTAMFWKHCAP